MLKIKIVIIVIAFFTFGCSSTSKSIEKNDKVNTDSSIVNNVESENFENKSVEDSNAVIESAFESDRFQVLFNEAKIHFADALIAQYEKDTVEVELQLRLTFESLSDIEVFNNLGEIEYNELMRFTNRLIHDFRKYVPDKAKLNEQFSVSDMRESMEYLAEDYIVPDTKEKIKIIEDREGHIPIILNNRVERIINYFQSKGKNIFQIWLNSKSKYEVLFNKILDEKEMPKELIYLAMIESGFKPTAYSYAYAVGQWQFIYATGKRYGLNRDYWVDERRDPVKSTYAAANYLKDLYDYYGDWYLSMAAYNAGRGRINRAIRYNDTRDFWKMHSLPRQTRNYVPTVLAATIISMDPEKYGFQLPKIATDKYEYDTLRIKNSIELRSIAKICNTKYSTIKELNPELRRYSTPNYDYVLKIPKGQRNKVKGSISKKINDKVKEVEYSVYKVKRGDSLIRISRIFGVSVSDIMSVNHLRNRQPILIGQKLIIPKSGSVRSTTKRAYGNYSSTHNKVIYKVKKGDNLGAIAENFGIRASNIRSWNNLRYREYIYPGQKLTIWTKRSNYSTSSNHKVIYTIKKGDNLGGIAEIYNTRAAEIRKWNNFSYGKTIYPGQKIVIWIPDNSNSSSNYYTVRRGDSLKLISKRINVSVQKLKRLNPNITPSKIYPGDKIRIN
ncbi:MAG: LysM peptidoglycan-binding domain-containing protein [Candidatus Marinimicrobia bacterium]|nr:LysM peptidoglycan-binding domain-containing protein [Candidatus Neomarinimicrobiota bacterium]